ncbi:MAG TPA: hypothetical protein VF582_00585, partial [Allosphingosinicella sp.]
MDLNIQRPPIDMSSHPSRTIAAALGALLLAVPAPAQETQGNGTVGAPELRGFRLPGTRVVPAPTTQPAPPTPDPPAAAEPRRQTPAPAAATAAAPQPQARRGNAPAAASPAPARSPAAAAPAAGTAPAEAPPISLDAFPTAQTYPTQDYSGAPLSLAGPPPGQDDQELPLGNMIWPALAAGLALLAGLFFMQRRRRAALAGDAEVLERSVLPEAPGPGAAEPAPLPVRTPVAVKEEEDEGLQPVIELQFKPDRMVATDKQAAVHFDLAVLNSGQAPARNV